MEKLQINDWKSVADSYFDKCTSLAVFIILFAFLVSPKFEVKAYEHKQKMETVAEFIPPEIKEKIEPPAAVHKPVVEIVVDDDTNSDDDEDIQIVDTIESTKLDPVKEIAPPPSSALGTTPKFVVYEESPKAIKRVEPEWPEFAKKAGIQGTVYLEVEVLESGKVGAVNVLKSLTQALDEAAIKAVKKWEYKPAMNQNKPVACWIQQPIKFTIERN